MCCVPKAFRMAQEMGEGLGQCPFLFRPLPQGTLKLRSVKVPQVAADVGAQIA